MQRLILTVTLILTLTGCALVPVYKPPIEQGNVFDQEMLDKLHPGMSKPQVQYIMGTPVLEESFDHNRWDYVYTYKAEGHEPVLKRATVFFENNRVVKILNKAYPQVEDNTHLPVPIVDERHVEKK